MDKGGVLHWPTTETEYPNNSHMYTGKPETWELPSLLRLNTPAVLRGTWEHLESCLSLELDVQRSRVVMPLMDDNSSCSNKSALTIKKQRKASRSAFFRSLDIHAIPGKVLATLFLR